MFSHVQLYNNNYYYYSWRHKHSARTCIQLSLHRYAGPPTVRYHTKGDTPLTYSVLTPPRRISRNFLTRFSIFLKVRNKLDRFQKRHHNIDPLTFVKTARPENLVYYRELQRATHSLYQMFYIFHPHPTHLYPPPKRGYQYIFVLLSFQCVKETR